MERKGPEAALRMIGLAARAGAVRYGTERVREAARAGELCYALVADDASGNTMDKLIPTLQSRGVPHAVAFSRDTLGGAIGRGPIGAVGFTDRSLAGRIRGLVEDAGVEE